jgi:hypothetical protein
VKAEAESAVPDVHSANYSRAESSPSVLGPQRMENVTQFMSPMSPEEYFKLPNTKKAYYNAPDGKEYFKASNGEIYGKKTWLSVVARK